MRSIVRFRLFIVAFAVLFCSLGSCIATAQAKTKSEEVMIEVDIRGRRYALEAVIVRPVDARGTLPLALMTHGSPRDRADRAKYRARAMLPQARDLAQRGWMVVAFMRRGFGQSQGPFAEGFDCLAPDFRLALMRAAEDIEAVRQVVSRREDVDATRVLGLGVSAGAAAMLAWAAIRPEGLVGVINISGGTGALMVDRHCDEAGLVAAFGHYGANARVPTRWFYAENDSYFGPALVQRLLKSFNKAGGDAKLTLFDPIGTEGHRIWDAFEGRKRWLPAVDEFLRAQGLPTWDKRPFEAFASGIDARQGAVLARYLEAPGEKALALSDRKKRVHFWAGESNLEAARLKSLAGCVRDAGEQCRVVIENFHVLKPSTKKAIESRSPVGVVVDTSTLAH